MLIHLKHTPKHTIRCVIARTVNALDNNNSCKSIRLDFFFLLLSSPVRQVLKISKSVSMSGLNGKVINLMSFDSYRFDGMIALVHYLWKGPIEVIVFGYFLYREIGYYGWIGVGFILCFVPIQSE